MFSEFACGSAVKYIIVPKQEKKCRYKTRWFYQNNYDKIFYIYANLTLVFPFVRFVRTRFNNILKVQVFPHY